MSQPPAAAPPAYRFLDRVRDIEEYLSSLGSQPALALDLEADSLYSYQEKVCLIQISTATGNVVLDPLRARAGLHGLGPLLADRGMLKVFHGADYDIRLLKKDFGFQVQHIADTMVAAQLVGRPLVGLAALLGEEFGLTLQKKYQRSDWTTRPLERERLRYAALDTAYLIELWQRLRRRLVELGRLAWAEEEFRLLEAVAPAAPHEPCCFDVKGAGRFSPRELAVLQGLLLVRDAAARAWDRPPFKVLPDQVLLGWAQWPPQRREQVLRTRGANQGILRRLAPQILEAVQAARDRPLAACPQRHRGHFTPLTHEQKERLARLKQVREDMAQSLDLSAGLLVTTETLEALARAGREEAAELLQASLKRWQQQVLGRQLEAVLAR